MNQLGLQAPVISAIHVQGVGHVRLVFITCKQLSATTTVLIFESSMIVLGLEAGCK